MPTRWGLLLTVFVLCTGCLVSSPANNGDDDDDDTPVETLIRLLEWRLGGFGPGIPDRLAVFFRRPYADPVEDYTSDQDGEIRVTADTMVNLAVEAPHGELFYLLPHLGNDALNIAHPNWPPPTMTVPLHVMFEPGGASFTGGTLFGGGGSTVQSEAFSGMASSYDLDVQERNFHPDGSVTIAAQLGPGPTPQLRAAIQQLPDSDGNVTLDQDFAGFDLTVTSSDPAINIDETTLTGNIAGAEIPLTAGAQVQLPLAGSGLGLDVFESYSLVINGTAGDGSGLVTAFFAAILLDPSELSDLVDPTAGAVSFELDTQPVETATTTGDDEIVRAVSLKLTPNGVVEGQIVSTGTGGDTPVLRLTDETRLQIEGRDASTDQNWTSTVEGGTGPIAAAPDITITDVQVSGSADGKTVDADWVVHPTGCNAMGVHPELASVSEWFVPFYSDGTEPGCYTLWVDSIAGQGGEDEGVTIDFVDEDAAVVASTSSTLNAGASWTLGSESAFNTPTTGDTHSGHVHAAEMSSEDEVSDIIRAGLQAVDGAVVVTGAEQPDAYVPQYFVLPSSSAQPYEFTWQ